MEKLGDRWNSKKLESKCSTEEVEIGGEQRTWETGEA